MSDYLERGWEQERARLDEVLMRMNALVAEIEEEIRASEAEGEREDEERAKAARAGELGPDWRKIQQRIDLGETTLADVLGGVDETLEARNIRATAAANLTAWGEQLRERLVEDPEAANPLAELALSDAELSAKLEHANRTAREEP
jgi:hypothetical protein